MIFVTGTGTDVGKTHVTALLLRQLRAMGRAPRALKPVLSGFDPTDPTASDAGQLLDALGLLTSAATLDQIAPWRFSAPLSPDMAARREGRAIDFAALVDFCRAAHGDPLLIEGVGGAMVPLDDRHSVLDWMAALGAPALVIGGTYLGAISHALTTVAAIRARHVPIRAIILSESRDSPVPAAETAETIARFSGLPVHIVARDDTAPGLAATLFPPQN